MSMYRDGSCENSNNLEDTLKTFIKSDQNETNRSNIKLHESSVNIEIIIDHAS